MPAAVIFPGSCHSIQSQQHQHQSQHRHQHQHDLRGSKSVTQLSQSSDMAQPYGQSSDVAAGLLHGWAVSSRQPYQHALYQDNPSMSMQLVTFAPQPVPGHSNAQLPLPLACMDAANAYGIPVAAIPECHNVLSTFHPARGSTACCLLSSASRGVRPD